MNLFNFISPEEVFLVLVLSKLTNPKCIHCVAHYLDCIGDLNEMHPYALSLII